MGHRNKGMRFDKMFRTIGPFVAMAALGGMMAGRRDWNCNFNGKDFRFHGKAGVKLDELDMAGEPPEEVVLVGPDQVIISEGEDFSITLQGEDGERDNVRFLLEGETLYILRDDMQCCGGEQATANITMPVPRKIVTAGSGKVAASAMAREAELIIAGSGQISVLDIDIERFDVTIAGSGHLTAGGKVKWLDLSVAGSGVADMAGLEAEEADIDIAGSGNASFSSDGEVHANIMGSGNVTVRGSARCRVNSMGSGSLVCERREDEAA